MPRIDELHLEHPFMGARMLRDQLHREGIKAGRRHIDTRMQRMGIATLAPQPGTSKRAPGHKIYPYLLRGLAITRTKQLWALETTYIPMARGFVYLTAEEFTRVVLGAGCKLSMDGRGAWRDNVFVERLWRNVKYERVYLKAYDSVSAARSDIADYLIWYNVHRAHSRLERLTPDEKYFVDLPHMKLAGYNEISGAPRVTQRGPAFLASDARRRGQLCTFSNPHPVHLYIGKCCSNKRGHFYFAIRIRPKLKHSCGLRGFFRDDQLHFC
jgi:putative transposase